MHDRHKDENSRVHISASSGKPVALVLYCWLCYALCFAHATKTQEMLVHHPFPYTIPRPACPQRRGAQNNIKSHTRREQCRRKTIRLSNQVRNHLRSMFATKKKSCSWCTILRHGGGGGVVGQPLLLKSNIDCIPKTIAPARPRWEEATPLWRLSKADLLGSMYLLALRDDRLDTHRGREGESGLEAWMLSRPHRSQQKYSPLYLHPKGLAGAILQLFRPCREDSLVVGDAVRTWVGGGGGGIWPSAGIEEKRWRREERSKTLASTTVVEEGEGGG